MKYEIDTNNAISVYAENETIPFLFQPNYPNGLAWENREAAEAWAIAYVAYFQDPENTPFPSEPPLTATE